MVVQVPKYNTDMDFHEKNKSEDDLPRMPTDGSTLKNIEEKLSIFKEEPCNVILSLEVDGVNPFGELCSTYSVWPICFINNNLPPSMSIKREITMLEMILPCI